MPDIKFSCHYCDQPIACAETDNRASINCPSCAKPLIVPAVQSLEGRDVFISYRRDGGDLLARLVMNALVQRGYSVFMDAEALKHGRFDTALLGHIELSTDIVLICSPGVLDRCANENDWVRQEIRHALKRKKHIVRLMTRDFQMPPKESLPPDIAELAESEAVFQQSANWNPTIELLAAESLHSQPDTKRRRVDEASEEWQIIAWNQLRARVTAGIAGIVLLMLLVSIPSIFNHALNTKWHHLGMVGKEKFFHGVACTLVILLGSWLAFAGQRLGAWIILGGSAVMAFGQLILSFENYKALKPFIEVYHANPTRSMVVWSLYIIPFLVPIYLYRKGK
jgi:hypothetical protein